MAKFTIQAGVEVDAASPAEVRGEADRVIAAMAARDVGIKFGRLPLTLSGTPAGGNLTIGGDSGQQPVGPAGGWIWEFKRIAISGLARGTSPDVMQLYFYGASGRIPQWEFNGNNWAYTFGRGELVMRPQEYIMATNIAALTSTSLITLSGNYVQYVAEKYAEGLK
jgi:hypothetical protein